MLIPERILEWGEELRECGRMEGKKYELLNTYKILKVTYHLALFLSKCSIATKGKERQAFDHGEFA